MEDSFSDARGEIRRMDLFGCKMNVLFSKQGVLRSGDVHPVAQHNLILRGRVELTTREAGRDVVRHYAKNDFITIPANIPHLYRFVEETVMLEYWDGPLSVEYFEPYRRQVEEQLQHLAENASNIN